jgi:hypothetical protein
LRHVIIAAPPAQLSRPSAVLDETHLGDIEAPLAGSS